MVREIILDTETTGLDPVTGHRVIEIGCLEMKDRVLTGRKFHHYINPEREVPYEAYRIHGISTDFLLDKPKFAEIADDFLEFIDGGKLVIHNAPFDIKFLNHELSLLKLISLDIKEVIDTLPMAKRLFPGAKVNLDALCKKYKIDNSSRTYHGALLDAYLLAEIYIELTGGRQTSFMLNATTSQSDGVVKAQNVKAVGNGLIITPTEEEKNKHEKFLKRAFG